MQASESHPVITVSAPGSLMLLGEHAVLEGRAALVAAVDYRISVSVQLGKKGQGRWVVAEKYGQMDLDATVVAPSFTFVKAAFDQAVKDHRSLMPHDFTLQITSNCPDHVGFGSSAAIVVAVLGALHLFSHSLSVLPTSDFLVLWKAALNVIRQVQGLGSGVDAAASLWGSVLLCDPSCGHFIPIAEAVPLVAIYSGQKQKTAEVVQLVQQRFSPFPSLREALFDVSQTLTREGQCALQEQNWKQLGQCMNMAQGLMEAYGVNTPLLQEIVHRLRTCSGVYGAKISGSGLGDCVIGLGQLEIEEKKYFDPHPIFPIRVAKEGLRIEPT